MHPLSLKRHILPNQDKSGIFLWTKDDNSWSCGLKWIINEAWARYFGVKHAYNNSSWKKISIISGTKSNNSVRQREVIDHLGTGERPFRGRSRISRKGVHRGFITFFLNIPWKWNNLVSLSPDYFIFIGYMYLKTGGWEGGLSQPPEPPLDPPLPFGIRHCDQVWSKFNLFGQFGHLIMRVQTVCKGYLQMSKHWWPCDLWHNTWLIQHAITWYAFI